MQPTDAQIGFVLLGVLLLFREMMFWYSKNKSGNGKAIFPTQMQKEWAQLFQWVRDLYFWHKPEWPDQPGQKVWYTDKQLRETLERNNELIHTQNLLLDTLIKQGKP